MVATQLTATSYPSATIPDGIRSRWAVCGPDNPNMLCAGRDPNVMVAAAPDRQMVVCLGGSFQKLT